MVCVAGVGSAFCAGESSSARTLKVCAPPASGDGGVNGELQAVNGPPSMRHSNVAPGSDEKVHVGVASAIRPLGPVSMDVSGGGASETVIAVVSPRVLPWVSVCVAVIREPLGIGEPYV